MLFTADKQLQLQTVKKGKRTRLRHLSVLDQHEHFLLFNAVHNLLCYCIFIKISCHGSDFSARILYLIRN